MKPLLLFLLMLALLLTATACGEDEIPTTPTPFDMGQTAVAIITGSQPTAVTLAELSADPEAYTGQFLQLSGNYQHLPLLVCNSETLRSAAGWLLVENADTQEVDEESGETEEKSEPALVAAGGFDSQLRHLVPEGTPLTVNGYWRHWEGPVGCGKQAVSRQIWYLKVTEIVEPAQLARVPITPGATTPADGSETAVPTEEGEGAPGFPITPTLPVPITATQPLPDIPTPATLPTDTPALPGIPTPTIPTLEPTPTREEGNEGTPSATPGGEGSTTTPTLTNTPPPGASLTPTPTPGTPTPGTPTVTAQPGTYTIVEVDPINPDEAMYGVEDMGPWQKQNWPLTLTNSEIITIGIAAEPTMNLAVAVYDEADNLLIEQNNAPAGQLERVVNLRVDPDIAYVIQIYETNGREGTYFMTIVGDQTEVVLNSRGILTYGQTRQDMLAEDHRHFWYFYGNAGDIIDITTTTDADKLLLISLYDMNADLVVDEDGIELEYMEEEILDLELPETGLYLVWLEEFAYEAAPYTITVRNN